MRPPPPGVNREDAVPAAKPLCFVAIPFDSELDEFYHTTLSPAIEEAGLVPRRAGDAPTGVSVPVHISNTIHRAQLIVGVARTNPNVWFELGMAHALEKPILLLTPDATLEVPANLEHLQAIVYDARMLGPGLRRQITTSLLRILEASKLVRTEEGPATSPPVVRALRDQLDRVAREIEVAQQEGFVEDVLRLCRKAIHTALSLNETPAVAHYLNQLANAFQLTGDHRAAMTYLQEALDFVVRKGGDATAEATCYANLANAYSTLGDLDKAGELYQKAVARSPGDAGLQSAVDQGLAVIAQIRGQLGEAERLLRKSATRARAAGDRWTEARSHVNLASVLLSAGRDAEARRLMEASEGLLAATMDRHGRARVLHLLAVAHWNKRKVPEALGALEKSLKLKEELGDEDGQVAGLLLKAKILAARKDFGDSLALLAKALDLSLRSGNRLGQMWAMRRMAGQLDSLGQRNQARRFLQAAATAARDLGAPEAPAFERALAALSAPVEGA